MLEGGGGTAEGVSHTLNPQRQTNTQPSALTPIPHPPQRVLEGEARLKEGRFREADAAYEAAETGTSFCWECEKLTNSPGHLWRDKWAALSGPFTELDVCLPRRCAGRRVG